MRINTIRGHNGRIWDQIEQSHLNTSGPPSGTMLVQGLRAATLEARLPQSTIRMAFENSPIKASVEAIQR